MCVLSLQKCNNEQEIISVLRNMYLTRTHEDFHTHVTEMMNNIQSLYHNDGNSPWSDEQYDIIVDVLKNEFDMDVENSVESIGASVSSTDAVKLPYFMGSMNKYKTPKLVNNWLTQHKKPYIVSAKLDGISAMYVNGKLYTRGNGTYGRNISYLIPYLQLGTLNGQSVRGELIMKKHIFEMKYKDTFANARNLVCGILNRQYKEEYSSLYKDIDFIAYDMYGVSQSYAFKFKWLNENGFHVVSSYGYIEDLTIQKCDSYLTQWKHKDYSYEIDGIIVSNHDDYGHSNNSNPSFAFAYKNNNIGIKQSVGIVRRVIWNISKDNYIKPTIQLLEPIYCDQSKVEYVTGFNARYIVDNNISCGSRLLIGLSGNVIPHIFKVLMNGDKLGYQCLCDVDCTYTWSKNKVDMICSNKDNHHSTIKQNVLFFKSLGLKCNIQEKTLYNVYDGLGIYLLKDILSLSLEEWVKVDKMGEKKASQIMDGFYQALHWPLQPTKENFLCMNYFVSLCVGLQSFERGFAIKKIKLYVDYVYGLSFLDFEQFYDNTYIESQFDNIMYDVEQQKPKQITCDTMKLFLDGFIKMNDKMNSLYHATLPFEIVHMKTLLNGILKEQSSLAQPANPTNHEFVFSGFRHKALMQLILDKGGTIKDDVSKTTTALIVKDKSNSSKKTQKAFQLGVSIFDLNELIKHHKEYKDITL